MKKYDLNVVTLSFAKSQQMNFDFYTPGAAEQVRYVAFRLRDYVRYRQGA
jgi:hypothetical protein